MEKNRLRAIRSPGFLTMVTVAFAFLLTFNCATALAWYFPGQGWIESIWPPPLPKDPQDPMTFSEQIPVSCHDAFTMAPLDCPFSISISEDTSMAVGVKGGHTHSRMVGTGIGSLSGVWATQFSQWEVRGQTAQTFVVKFDHPEMSGGVIMTSVMPAPPGYVCTPDGTMAACTIIYYIVFQVPGLVLLPPSPTGDYALTGQNASNRHADNHYGTPKLVAAIKEVAMNFKDLKGRPLGVNDMSLPWGGLYDYHSTGFSPHTYHRKGTSVDIDSKTVKVNQDINQPVDPSLQSELTKEFERQGCYKEKEATIHYECK